MAAVHLIKWEEGSRGLTNVAGEVMVRPVEVWDPIVLQVNSRSLTRSGQERLNPKLLCRV